MLGLAALKAGVAEAEGVQSMQALVRDDPRFAEVWGITASVPGSFAQLNAAAMFSVLSGAYSSRPRPIHIVEIGSYLGRSTVFFGKTLQSLGRGTVAAIDPHTGDRQQMEILGAATLPSLDLFRAHIQACDLSDIVEPIVARSHDAAGTWNSGIDLLYVDGWHSYDDVMQDGRDWLPHLRSDGVVFFDDYSRYEEVRCAVRDLAAEGAFKLWGNSFGQAVGGPGAPPSFAHRLLKVSGGRLTRRLHRFRG